MHPIEREAPMLFPAEVSGLKEINERIRRFMRVANLNQACSPLDKAMGVTDPDGNKWIIGDPLVRVDFARCYVNDKIFK